MKRLILITGICLLAAFSQAQTISAPVALKSTPTHVATDTLVAAGSKYQYVTVVGKQSFITFASLVTKISGTVAGTAIIEGSLDNVTYYPITGITAFTLTDVATQKPKWDNIPHTWVWYRLNVTTTGTSSVKFATLAIWRP